MYQRYLTTPAEPRIVPTPLEKAQDIGGSKFVMQWNSRARQQVCLLYISRLCADCCDQPRASHGINRLLTSCKSQRENMKSSDINTPHRRY